MYDSPITTMITEICNNVAKRYAEQTENMVYEEVRNIGVHVDKDELLKALEYDRHQYEKGYAEALADYRDALLNPAFLKYNYGINNIDMFFISSFEPAKIIREYKEWKREDT